ncbi:MAG: VWA domain-containing protein [Pyrinomonadaceae bacterium]
MTLFAVIASVFVMSAIAAAQSRRVAPTPTPTPPDDTERVITEEVKLNVLAFDENGKFFSGVTERDLVITDNNILHQPTSVRRIPANVVIVMDTGGELRQVKSLDKTRGVARAVVSALAAEDRVAIVQYADRAEIVSEWTTDRQETLAAIGRTKFGRKSAFVEAIDIARDLLVKNPADNRHIVLISDGTDSTPGTSAKFDAFQRLAETDISVHVISYTALEAADIEPRTKGISNSPPPRAMPPEVAAQLPNGARDAATAPKFKTINLDRTLLRRLKARKADLEDSQEKLDKLAETTNGTFILPDTLDEMLEKAPIVARMIDAAYVVTYTPKEPIVDRKGLIERRIEVTSRREGLVVQARRRLLFDTTDSK